MSWPPHSPSRKSSSGGVTERRAGSARDPVFVLHGAAAHLQVLAHCCGLSVCTCEGPLALQLLQPAKACACAATLYPCLTQ
jgi:hypothetical protein